MSTTTVNTQAELDAALAAHRDDPDAEIYIRSTAGVWLEIRDTGRCYVWAYDSSTVWAYNSSTVWAYDSSTVWASGSSTVWASGSSTVWAYGSSTVWAYGSSTVRASDSSTVQASGSSTVRASDSSTVRASDSSTVRAFDSSTVQASKYVAVHLYSARATVEGGVLIDLTQVDERDAREWCDIHGANIVGDTVLLYKAVDGDYAAGHSYRLTTYAVGSTVTAPDWRADHSCGGGLHLSPHPEQALVYRPDAARMLQVEVDLADLSPIPSLVSGGAAKCKVRACRVLREVALDGSELAGAA